MFRNEVNNVDQKTILITGATDGLGKQTALQLARSGAKILLHGRNPEKLEFASNEIKTLSNNPHIFSFTADLQSLSQVRRLAGEIKEFTPQLDVLINNAGVYMHRRVLSEDGYEMTFAVNHLAPFLLTHLLLPLLKQSPPAKIITVSSAGHQFVTLNLKNLQGDHFYWDWVAYCRSKLMNLLFSFELSERIKGQGICAVAIHPGVIRTKLTKKALVSWGISVEEGAKSITRLALDPSIADYNGGYFHRYHLGKASLVARNRKLQKKFWQISADLVGI